MKQLEISRGNVNMNIRDLIDWGLVSRIMIPGERKEYFSAEKDMWKVTTFLTHLENLSPAAQEYWKKAYGVPPRPGQEHHEHGEHGHGD